MNTSPNRRIPVIQTGHALQSLRDSGHNLPTALGEVIDNCIEAGANKIAVRLDQGVDKAGRKHVHRISTFDDGIGMDSETLQRYLVLGFSSRYMRKDTIGKFGVGAKLAALNFGRRIEAWSRSKANGPWLYTYFDLDEALDTESNGNNVELDFPREEPFPSEFSALVPSGTGTVVVWSKVDRLEEGRLAANFDELRLELEKELSRIFRHFINGGIRISINDKDLIAHDPLMQMEGTWADVTLTKELEKVNKPKSRGLQHFASELVGDDEFKVAGSKATIKVTVYPKEIVRGRGKGGDALARALRVPENQGAISFVRMNREVAYTLIPRSFPGGVQDPDRFIGVEVLFKPELDEYFGIRNVKRGVEPHGDLREQIRKHLDRYIPQARKIIERYWGEKSREEHDSEGEHTSIMELAKEVDATMPKGRAESNMSPDEVEEKLKELAVDVGNTEPAEQDAYVERVQKFPYILESVDFPGNMFISTEHLAGKVVVRLNTRHPFYREMWEPIKDMAERDGATVSGAEAVKVARRTIEALTLLLIAYGKAESMNETPRLYDDLVQYWGQFLSTLLKNVKDAR